ncbi:MAG: hypothetical protein NC200_07995 [Candidatus Gastranaerophilales bacterium]|nr:hypothetical protein [Candidatus Gastranaerophilales bacterium]
MARDIINVQYPLLENSQSVGTTTVTKTTVSASKGITINDAFANKNNTLVICIENTASSAVNVTFVAGDTYPNSMLGNLTVSLPSKTLNAFQVQDMSRFENKDGSVNIDFASTFTGNIFAIAKSADLNK